MLKYNIRLTNSEKKEYLNLDDFYISPDLGMISGTTEEIHDLSADDNIWVSSEYLPHDEKVEVMFVDKVIRNGFILIKKNLSINSLRYQKDYSDDNEPDIALLSTVRQDEIIHYIEHNGIVYYEKNGLFPIGTKLNDSTVVVYDKIYIEDKKVNIDGKLYNVTIGDNVIIYDNDNNLYHGEGIDLSNVKKDSSVVYKIGLRNKPERIINLKSIQPFGYMPYIIYNNERIEITTLRDENGNLLTNENGKINTYGVNLNGKNYVLDSNFYSATPANEEIFSISDYDVEVGLDIEGVDYQVFFEPKVVADGDFLCVETVSPNNFIGLNDILTFKSNSYTNCVDVLGEDDMRYIFLNGVRHNSIKNFYDRIVINNKYYLLEYQGDSANPHEGMLAIVHYDNGFDTFRVESVNNHQAQKIVKVNYVNGEWKKAYTMVVDGSVQDDNASTYQPCDNYTIVHGDGFLIDGEHYPIQQREIYSEGFVSETVDVVYINKPVTYNLRVYKTLSNSQFICTTDIDPEIVANEDFEDQRASIYWALINNANFVMYHRSSLFGNKDLTADKWLKEAVEEPNPTSTYMMSKAKERIRPFRKNSSYDIPIVLSTDLNNNLMREDMVTDYYCTELEDKHVNGIVDMEKDIYTPYVTETNRVKPIEKLVFNLHFRTRDMETWKIINDEGNDSTEDANMLSVGNLFSNWFVTDFYPYNQYESQENPSEFINNMINQSDLLGLLYFTTDDVKTKRKKLTGSFLRLTYFDSRDPSKQNMLGTSTVFFDCDKYFNVLNQSHDGVVYNPISMSLSPNRTESEDDVDLFVSNKKQAPTVLMEAFVDNGTESGTTSEMLYDESYRLSSQMVVSDRYNANHSSEGFYSYILKHKSNKAKKQTIYLKIEFFHAGLGIKIPMIIPTDNNRNAIDNWDIPKLETFKNGYGVDEIHMRQYIPIDIYYSLDERKFIYEISEKNNFRNTIRKGEKYVFNLFELKTKVN